MAAEKSPAAETPRATVHRAYQLYETGNFDELMDTFTEDALYDAPGSADKFEAGFAGHFQGKEQIKEHLAVRGRFYDISDMKRHHVIVGADASPGGGTWVTVPGSCTATCKATGKSIPNEWTHLFNIVDGAIASFRITTNFADSEKIMELPR